MSKTTTHKTRGTANGRTTNETGTTRTTQEHGTAQDSLLATLRANPHSTTAELAANAGIGRSTAGKLLARMAEEGTATRTSGTATGGRRPADRWAAGDADDPAPGTHDTPTDTAQTAPTEHTDPVDEPKPTAETAKASRLAPGGLRDLILSHLRAHAGEEFGPSQLGKVLGRSAGAINNALERLAKDGTVAKTVDAPKRFSAKSTGDQASTRTKASK